MNVSNNNITKTNLQLFDFNNPGGKHMFTPLHFAIYQNNYELILTLI